MVKRILKLGEPSLNKKALEVKVFDKELSAFACDLVETMNAENGLGLAAPQVGESKRVFVVDMCRRNDKTEACEFTFDGKKVPLELIMPLVAVNPSIENAGEYTVICEEGCLSIPGVYGEVERFEKVKLHYFDVDGNPHEIICGELFARCVQHENDHLDGITFTDRMLAKNITKILPKLKKIKRQSRDFLKGQKNG